MPTSSQVARDILGQNFFGFEDWSRLYGICFTKEQLESRAELPWTESQLTAPCPFTAGKRVNETHFAFLGLDLVNDERLTIIKLHELHPAPGKPCFFTYQRPLYPFATFEAVTTCEFRWYLMPLVAVSRTRGYRYEDQITLLAAIAGDYEVPRTVEEVLKVVLYYKKNAVYLDHDFLARCCDCRFEGRPVHVGTDVGGIGVGGWWDHLHPRFDIALTASRKLPL